MEPQNHGNTSSPADPPLKRKRGRPRKDESMARGEQVLAMSESDNTQTKQSVGPTAAGEGDMVGQMVHGVIDGKFDAGYLVKVKVGDTDTHLRGVVFLPGRVVPVTGANDLAPLAKMYGRKDIPIPVQNLPTQQPGSVPSSGQISKALIESKSLVPAFQGHGLQSRVRSSIPVAQDSQSAPTMMPFTNNLSGSWPDLSSDRRVEQQKSMEPGLHSQSASLGAVIVHDKAAEENNLPREFQASMVKDFAIVVKATEPSKLAPQSSTSTNLPPGVNIIDVKVDAEHQHGSCDLETTQGNHDELKSVTIDHGQSQVIGDTGSLSSNLFGLSNSIGKQASATDVGTPDLAGKIANGDTACNPNGNFTNDASNLTKAKFHAASTKSQAIEFSVSGLSAAPKLAFEGALLQGMIAPQFSTSSSCTDIVKTDLDAAPVTILSVTPFATEANPSPSEPKLAIDGPLK